MSQFLNSLKCQVIATTTLLSSCTGRMESALGSDASVNGLADSQVISARNFFEQRLGAQLIGECGSCHSSGSDAFLRAPAYDSLVGSSVVNVANAPSSTLLTRGVHAGPALTASSEGLVRTWLAQELAERRAAAPRTTTPVQLRDGFNYVELNGAGEGLDDAVIAFVAVRGDFGVFLSDVLVFAGARGLRLRHPTVVTWQEGVPASDPTDRLAGVDLTLAPFESETLGSGSISLAGFPASARLSFLFEQVGAMAASDAGVPADAGMGTSASRRCSQANTFAEVVRPQLVGYCSNCHSGSHPEASRVLDLSAIRSDAASANETVCSHFLSSMTASSYSQSGVWLAPDPMAMPSHDFKFGSDSALGLYRNALTRWAQEEGL